jgi:hypothetical protein
MLSYRRTETKQNLFARFQLPNLSWALLTSDDPYMYKNYRRVARRPALHPPLKWGRIY